MLHPMQTHEHIIAQVASMGSIIVTLDGWLHGMAAVAALVVPTVYYGFLLYDLPRVQAMLKWISAWRHRCRRRHKKH